MRYSDAVVSHPIARRHSCCCSERCPLRSCELCRVAHADAFDAPAVPARWVAFERVRLGVVNHMMMRHYMMMCRAYAGAHWRQTVFLMHVCGAVRLGGWAGLLAVIRSWTLPPGWRSHRPLRPMPRQRSACRLLVSWAGVMAVL